MFRGDSEFFWWSNRFSLLDCLRAIISEDFAGVSSLMSGMTSIVRIT